MFRSTNALLLASLSSTMTTMTMAQQSHVYDHYAGYLPFHSITDLASIDLDQYDINLELSDRKILEAYHIYEEGGHSGSYAILTLQNDEQLAGDYDEGTVVYGTNTLGEDIIGYLRERAAWKTTDVNPVITVTYPVGDKQATYSDCNVGALYRTSQADRDGCFTGSGTIGIGGTTFDQAEGYAYAYDVREDNRNDLTIRRFSTDANVTMKEFTDNTYIPEYQTFLDYYGDHDYADKYITSAYLGQHTNFKKPYGNFDFTLFTPGNRMGQGEAMKKGMAYLSVWMQVVLNVWTAADRCVDDTVDDNAIEFLDDAVALYTGSIVVTNTDGDDETGIFLHGLADTRAKQFKTAGHQNNADAGTAFVNIKIMDSFRAMKEILVDDDPELCATAETNRAHIINLMKVPLIQGLLRYTYIRQHEISAMAVDDQERTMAESATFAATLLPFVHRCDPKAAGIIHENTKIGLKVKTDYGAVHTAISSVYSCIGIDDCKLIGGVWDDIKKEYKSGAYPCGMDDPTLSKKSGASTFGRFARFVGISGLIVGLGYFLLKYKNRIIAYVRHVRNNSKDRNYQDGKDLPTSFSGNIAAVAEIS